MIATGAKRSAKSDTTTKSGSVKMEGAGSGANASKELTGNSVSAKKNADTKTGLNESPVRLSFFVPRLSFHAAGLDKDSLLAEYLLQLFAWLLSSIL